MKAQVLTRFGGPEGFELRDIAMPTIGPDEVLVAVHAASLNPADVKIRNNGPAHAPELPAVLGLDMAGVVAAVGSGVRGFREGDRVYGCCGGVRGVAGGTMADYVVADPDLLAPMPKRLGFREAAALPLVAITAYEAVMERGEAQATDHALIYGGTGGVGHIAIQLAKHRGARVAATVSDAGKAALAYGLGADEVINRNEEKVPDYVARLTAGEGFAAVIDAVGGANLNTAFEAARSYGTVVSISTRQSYDLTAMHAKSLSLHVIFMLIRMIEGRDRAAHGRILREVTELVDDDIVRPLLSDRHFALAHLPDAHRFLESGAAVGKVIVTVR